MQLLLFPLVLRLTLLAVTCSFNGNPMDHARGRSWDRALIKEECVALTWLQKVVLVQPGERGKKRVSQSPRLTLVMGPLLVLLYIFHGFKCHFALFRAWCSRTISYGIVMCMLFLTINQNQSVTGDRTKTHILEIMLWYIKPCVLFTSSLLWCLYLLDAFGGSQRRPMSSIFPVFFG